MTSSPLEVLSLPPAGKGLGGGKGAPRPGVGAGAAGGVWAAATHPSPRTNKHAKASRDFMISSPLLPLGRRPSGRSRSASPSDRHLALGVFAPNNRRGFRRLVHHGPLLDHLHDVAGIVAL